MNCLGKSRKGTAAASFFALLLFGFAGRASADTKPKFVYVANSGSSVSGEVVKSFQLTATATCTSHACASTLAISGSFTVTSVSSGD